MRFETKAAFAIASTNFRRTLLVGLAVVTLTSCGVDEDSPPATNTATTSAGFFAECFITYDNRRYCFVVGTCGMQEPPSGTVSRTCAPCGDFSSCWNSG